MSNIGWGLSGAGHQLFETFEEMEKIAKTHKLSCFLSGAGERVVHIYGLWERLKELCPGNYYREIVLEPEQGPSSPITGRFPRGKYKALIVSPASTNTVAKVVRGIADSLVTNAFSQARKKGIPILILPTDKEKEEITELPHLVDRKICREKLENSNEECRIIDLCPYRAIVEVDGLPKIDLKKCEGCKKCLEGCPFGAVSFRKKSKAKTENIDLENTAMLEKIKSVTLLEKANSISNVLEEKIDE